MHDERHHDSDQFSQYLEAKLRALPDPPVPPNLEARLLATIPAALPIQRRRWAVWAGVACASAAACLLAFLWFRGPRGETRDEQIGARGPGPGAGQAKNDYSSRLPVPYDALTTWQDDRFPGEQKALTFSWPLPEATPARPLTSIPPDLLDGGS